MWRFALLLGIMTLMGAPGSHYQQDKLMTSTNKIIYIGDTMCSWCWGISGELSQFAAAHEKDFPLLVIAGGLRPGTTEPIDNELAEFLQHLWKDVT